MIRIAVIDDHEFVRRGIASFIRDNTDEITVSAQGNSGKELLELFSKAAADIYIVDISMPDMDGICASEQIIEQNPSARIIVLSMHEDIAFIEQALKAGVRGYIVKDGAAEEIIRAVMAVNNGEYYISPKIAGLLIKNSCSASSDDNTLTDRENEILALIGKGMCSKDIAQTLHISVNTVNTHRKNISRKLDIHSVPELVRYALKSGISD